ncbi:MAG TPA: 6-phosphogluconolactonase [Verrucomicrobiae bacterium]|jgi:6-phosphogluconolactonase
MKPVELISFPNSAALAQAVASAWLETIGACQQRGQSQFVALSGGRIARDFFAATAETARSRRVSLDNVHFFWADERCVGSTDPESNFAAADQLLFQPLSIPSDHIHRILGEDPPPSAAENAEAEIRKEVPCNEAGQPVLDLIFLGMGEDGHVASLFPGGPEETRLPSAIYRAVTASKPPPQRITLCYPTIVAARHVWVLASGRGKDMALRSSLACSDQTPLARVLGSRQQSRVFSDMRPI